MGGSAENGTLSEEEMVVGLINLCGSRLMIIRKGQMIWGLFQGHVFQIFQVHWLSESKNGEFVEIGELLPEFFR